MERTKGSQSEIGMIYQYAVTAYLAGQLSSNELVKDYIIYSSAKCARKFDDIVAKVQLKERNAWFLSLIQVKHKESKKLNISDIIKGKSVEYDLSEYVSSFDEIMEDSRIACRERVPRENIRFCVFCNKSVQVPAFLRSECTFQLNLQRHTKSDFVTKAVLPFGDKCWKFECQDLIGSTYQRFLDGCYLYLEQVNHSKINKRIQDCCGVDSANDIVNYVKDYFNNNCLHKQGLHKKVFEIELQKIRLSNYISPLMQLVDLVDDDRVTIWNEITLHHDITIANKADDGDIEGCLYGCLAQRLKFLLKTDIDWNKLVIEQRELGSDIINKFIEYSKTKTLRCWISPPSTLKCLILEMWKFGDLPLILKTDTKLNHFEKYMHLRRSYVLIGDAEKRYDEISKSKLKIFSHLGNIENLKLRNRILENTVVSFQGREETSLKNLLCDDTELLVTFSAVDIIGLMKKRIAYLNEDCLKDTNYLAFLIEDEKYSANGGFAEPHVIGDNITIECHPSKIQGYTKMIKENLAYRYYTIYHLRRVDTHLVLIEGQKGKLGNYFIDQYGDPVYNCRGKTPIPIIGETIILNEINHVPRYLRRATITNISLNPRGCTIFLLSGDVETADLPVELLKDVSDIEKNITKEKSYFIKVSAKERQDYWNRFSILKCALLDVYVRDGKMELLRYKNCSNLSSIISYDGRKFSEREFFEETGDNPITVVTAEPGMGKSSLLKSLCNVCNTRNYILFYDLIYFQNYLNRNRSLLTKPIECVFEEIHQKKAKKYNSFLRILLERNGIILVLDSFDEIIPSCEKQVLAFIKTVANTGIQVIIATRLKDCGLLMEEFNSQMVKLDPLNGSGYPTEWKLNTELLSNIPSEFTKNPLYLNFLQMISQGEQRIMNITRFELYEKVIHMKIERRLRKIMISSYEAAVKDFVTLFERLALVAMFGKEKIEEELRWECSTESFDCVKFGIVTHFRNDFPVFDHFTFVEFLVAQWLVKAKQTYIYGRVARNIYQQLMDEGKMYVLDILSEHLDLQKAILQRNILRIKEICEETPDCLKDVDKLGRTALHTATICCRDTNRLQSSFQILNMIIQFIQRCSDFDMNKRDAIMEWDWTNYVNFDILDAGLFYNLIVTVEVYLNQERWKVIEWKNPSRLFPIQSFVVVLRSAMWRLSISAICNLLLLQLYDDQGFYNLYQACLGSSFNTDTPCNVNFETDEGLTSLHIACVYGSASLVNHLIGLGADINAADEFGCTPLYYNIMRYSLHQKHNDARHQDLAITRLLLNLGANFNLGNSFGNAPIHLTVQVKSTDALNILLEEGCNVNIQDAFGRTALHIAVEEKQPECAKVLLETGANPEIEDVYGNTPLYLAVCSQDEDMIRTLLEGGINVNFQNASCQTILHRVVSEKLLDMARLLLESGADANIQDEYGCSPLHQAVYDADVEIVRLLLEKGAEVNLQEDNGKTALHTATHEKHINMITLLLEKAADVNLQNDHGHTPLHVAVTFSHQEIVKLFLLREAKVNLQDISGETVLHKAAYGTRVDILGLLLENGADAELLNHVSYASFQAMVTATGGDKLNVLLTRRASENLQYIDAETGRNLYESRIDIIKLLLENQTGIGLLQGTSDGTPLYIAVHDANDNIVKLLLQRGANLNLRNVDGETALYSAVCGRRIDTIRLLLEHGADVNVQNIFDHTPLHVAAYMASDHIVKMLLEKGASVNVQDTHGETALHRAVAGRWVDKIRLLLQNETEDNLQNEDASPSRRDNEGAVRLLLEVSAVIDVQDSNAKAAACSAIDKKRKDTIKLLLENGADANLQDKHGCTPLHFATQRKEEDVVRLLLENGARIDIQNDYCQTALHWAVYGNTPNIVRLLLEQGTDVHIQLESTRHEDDSLYYAWCDKNNT